MEQDPIAAAHALFNGVRPYLAIIPYEFGDRIVLSFGLEVTSPANDLSIQSVVEQNLNRAMRKFTTKDQLFTYLTTHCISDATPLHLAAWYNLSDKILRKASNLFNADDLFKVLMVRDNSHETPLWFALNGDKIHGATQILFFICAMVQSNKLSTEQLLEFICSECVFECIAPDVFYVAVVNLNATQLAFFLDEFCQTNRAFYAEHRDMPIVRLAQHNIEKNTEAYQQVQTQFLTQRKAICEAGINYIKNYNQAKKCRPIMAGKLAKEMGMVIKSCCEVVEQFELDARQ